MVDINYLCRNKCQGIEGFYGSCCMIDNKNFIIGAYTEEEIHLFLEKLSKKFNR